MAQHMVIRREEYVAGTREHPEAGVFTQTHVNHRPIPWGKISIGEIVWMKWTGGPVVAKAKVKGFRHFENCTPKILRESTKGYLLYDLAEYWESLKPSFFGFTIYLKDAEWLDQVFEPAARSHRQSWFVLDTKEKMSQWLSPAAIVVTETVQRKKVRSHSISASLRFEVLRRDNFACTYCGRKPPEVKLHVDHVIPYSKGGLTALENLRAACQECNIGKGTKLL